MLLILMLMELTDLASGRVFCQDSHAMAWMPRGFTCPVMCESIRNAVERLVMLDYKTVVQEQLGAQEASIMDNEISGNFIKDDLRKPLHNSLNEIKKDKNSVDFEKNDKNGYMSPFLSIVIKNLRKSKETFRRSDVGSSATTHINDKENVAGKCWTLEKFEPKLLLGKLVRTKCTRKSNFDGNFVSIMTNILNKYVDTKFEFTEEMTEILLEHIFGKNVDLRNNIFDVNKLLKFLRNSLDLHKSHTKNEIILKSRHCLSISLPGCFCRRGYVENAGQCVQPSDCIRNEHYTQYLSRIIVL